MIADVMTDEELEELVRLSSALRGHRWPWAPLGAVLGGSVRMQAEILDRHQRQVSRWRSYGLSDEQADQCAIRLGLHPRDIWSGWDDVAMAVDHEEAAA